MAELVRLRLASDKGFKPGDIIELDLNTRFKEVCVEVYTLDGRLVRRNCEGPLGPGKYSWRWSGRNDLGERVAYGNYMVAVFGMVEPGTYSAYLRGKLKRISRVRVRRFFEDKGKVIEMQTVHSVEKKAVDKTAEGGGFKWAMLLALVLIALELA